MLDTADIDIMYKTPVMQAHYFDSAVEPSSILMQSNNMIYPITSASVEPNEKIGHLLVLEKLGLELVMKLCLLMAFPY